MRNTAFVAQMPWSSETWHVMECKRPPHNKSEHHTDQGTKSIPTPARLSLRLPEEPCLQFKCNVNAWLVDRAPEDVRRPETDCSDNAITNAKPKHLSR